MDLAELGALADRLEAVRSDRLAADKIAAQLKSEEQRLLSVVIAEMEGNELSSVGGKSCVLNRAKKQRAIATNWLEIHGFILKNDAFDLLHKRLTEGAVLARLDDGVVVPGTSVMEYSKITFAKART